MVTVDTDFGNVQTLDSRLCYLAPDDVAFFLSEARIDTEEALKKHLIDVQAKAYKVSVSASTISPDSNELGNPWGSSLSFHKKF